MNMQNASSQHSTVEDAARRLLAALDALDVGCVTPGFQGWENGRGEPVGDEVEKARKALALQLTRN
jgi:hypothetical protein